MNKYIYIFFIYSYFITESLSSNVNFATINYNKVFSGDTLLCEEPFKNESIVENCIVNPNGYESTCYCKNCYLKMNLKCGKNNEWYAATPFDVNNCDKSKGCGVCKLEDIPSSVKCFKNTGVKLHGYEGESRSCVCLKTCKEVKQKCVKKNKNKKRKPNSTDYGWIQDEKDCDVKTKFTKNKLKIEYKRGVYTYSCMPGYKLVGNVQQRCINGDMSVATPKCERLPRTISTSTRRQRILTTVITNTTFPPHIISSTTQIPSKITNEPLISTIKINPTSLILVTNATQIIPDQTTTLGTTKNLNIPSHKTDIENLTIIENTTRMPSSAESSAINTTAKLIVESTSTEIPSTTYMTTSAKTLKPTTSTNTTLTIIKSTVEPSTTKLIPEITKVTSLETPITTSTIKTTVITTKLNEISSTEITGNSITGFTIINEVFTSSTEAPVTVIKEILETNKTEEISTKQPSNFTKNTTIQHKTVTTDMKEDYTTEPILIKNEDKITTTENSVTEDSNRKYPTTIKIIKYDDVDKSMPEIYNTEENDITEKEKPTTVKTTTEIIRESQTTEIISSTIKTTINNDNETKDNLQVMLPISVATIIAISCIIIAIIVCHVIKKRKKQIHITEVVSIKEKYYSSNNEVFAETLPLKPNKIDNIEKIKKCQESGFSPSVLLL